MWKYYNCNPLHREVNDCVVRAISLAESKSWDYTYQELSKLAQYDATLLDDSLFVEKYLNSKYPTICYKCDGRRMTVAEFLKQNSQGIYLISIRGHITCAIDGIVQDTWDCTSKTIWNVWKVD